MCSATGADSSRFVEEIFTGRKRNGSELVYYDAPRCILCFRCVRVCDILDVKALWGLRGQTRDHSESRGSLECESVGCASINLARSG